jgi:hypothetical protein
LPNRLLRPAVAPLLILILAATGSVAQESDDYVKKALEDSTFAWRSIASGGITIYYRKGSFADEHRMMILRSVSAALDEDLELLGETEYDAPLNVFYLDSRQEMERIIGRPYAGFSNWGANGVFLVLNPEWRSFEKHEIAHMVTMGMWGPPHETSRWMIEGVAVFCDGWCRDYTVDEVAMSLLSGSQLPPLQELFEDYSALGEIRAGFYAASVIGFIYHTYGPQALRRLWDHGCGDMKGVLGDDVGDIENAWKDYLKQTVKTDPHVDLDVINKKGC